MQIGELVVGATVNFAGTQKHHLCLRAILAHGFEQVLRAEQVNVQRFVRLLVAESHRRLARQVGNVRGLHELNHVLHVFEVQQVTIQVFDAFDFLPGLRLFVAKAVQIVGGTHKARQNVVPEGTRSSCYKNAHIFVLSP